MAERGTRGFPARISPHFSPFLLTGIAAIRPATTATSSGAGTTSHGHAATACPAGPIRRERLRRRLRAVPAGDELPPEPDSEQRAALAQQAQPDGGQAVSDHPSGDGGDTTSVTVATMPCASATTRSARTFPGHVPPAAPATEPPPTGQARHWAASASSNTPAGPPPAISGHRDPHLRAALLTWKVPSARRGQDLRKR